MMAIIITIITYNQLFYFRYFIWMNLIAHSFMYTYYAAMSRGIKVPRAIAKCVTLLQLAQMFVGLGVSISVAVVKFKLYVFIIKKKNVNPTIFQQLALPSKFNKSHSCAHHLRLVRTSIPQLLLSDLYTINQQVNNQQEDSINMSIC